ncbi:MAG: hypothetical protein JWQ22_2832 [Devosia sp.]|nr:hypothetical protein [Devosia sp.]
MVHGFAGQSGGAVRIYSEVDQGTMVCIYLPRYFGDDAQETAGDETVAVPAVVGGPVVLLVDDEPLVRMVASEHLDDLGYTVLEAGDANEALQIFDANGSIALLVTDVGLPGVMSGRQLAEVIREKRPDREVLFITGYAENAVFNHGHLERGMHMLGKPFQMDVFAAKVADLLAVSGNN